MPAAPPSGVGCVRWTGSSAWPKRCHIGGTDCLSVEHGGRWPVAQFLAFLGRGSDLCIVGWEDAIVGERLEETVDISFARERLGQVEPLAFGPADVE